MSEPDEKYYKLLKEYDRWSKDRLYVFEMTKCCGYSELLYIYKNDSCLGLYKMVSLQMATNDINRLYLTRNDGTEVIVPLSNMNLSAFISEEIMHHGLRSLYGPDVPVVYKLYYDDGHHHEKHVCIKA